MMIIAIFPVYGISAVFSGYVWGQMMDRFATPLPKSIHIAVYFATIFIGRLPGGIWHIIGRVTWYEKLGIPKRVTTIVSALQMLFVIWSGVIVAFITLPFISPNLRSYSGLFLLSSALLFFIVNPKSITWILNRFLRIENSQLVDYPQILKWLIQYMMIWILGGMMLYLIILSIEPSALSNLVTCLGAWSIGGVSGTLITILPGGLGLTEASLSLVLSTTFPASLSVLAAILMRVVLTVYEFILSGSAYLLIKKRDLIS
jgi:hypothetical protein